MEVIVLNITRDNLKSVNKEMRLLAVEEGREQARERERGRRGVLEERKSSQILYQKDVNLSF